MIFFVAYLHYSSYFSGLYFKICQKQLNFFCLIYKQWMSAGYLWVWYLGAFISNRLPARGIYTERPSSLSSSRTLKSICWLRTWTFFAFRSRIVYITSSATWCCFPAMQLNLLWRINCKGYNSAISHVSLYEHVWVRCCFHPLLRADLGTPKLCRTNINLGLVSIHIHTII